MLEKEDITIAMREDSLLSLVKLPDRFKMRGLIGQGGMGYVFKAYDTLLQREVAIKILMYEGARLENEQARFLQEARILSSLQHDNIVAVLLSDLTESGDPYYAMELLEGESLWQELERSSPMKPERFYEIFGQVLDGLSSAHNSRIVHRDLKPTNIMLSKLNDGSTRVKLIDFGIARTLQEGSAGAETTLTLSRTNTIVGSPVYMSPEQCRGSNVDQLSDIYSLGCIMYECMTGRIVFQRDSAFQIMYAQMNEEPVSLESIARSDGARSLGRLVDRCLKKNPSERPQSADEIKQELNRIYLQHTSEMGTFGIKQLAGNAKSKAPLIKAVCVILLLASLLSTWLYIQISNENEGKRKELANKALAAQKSRDLALKKEQKSLKNEIAGMRQQNESSTKRIESASNPEQKFELEKELMERSVRLAQANMHLGKFDDAAKDLGQTIDVFKKNMSGERAGKSWIAALLIARADTYVRMAKFELAEKDLAEAEIVDVGRGTSWGLHLNKIRLHIAQSRLDLVEPDLLGLSEIWQSGHSEYKLWSSKLFGTPMSLTDALSEIYAKSNLVPAESTSQKLIKAKLNITIADLISTQKDASRADFLKAQKCLSRAEPSLAGMDKNSIDYYLKQIERIKQYCKLMLSS